MRDFNNVVLIGRLVRDPETKTTGDGTQYATFTIANNQGKRKDGTELPANFFDCVAWNKTAEIVSNYMQKGKKVLLAGTLKQNKYTTEDGKNRSRVVVNVINITFMDGQRDETVQESEPGNQNENVNTGLPEYE